ncbi:glycosyl hydrolase family 18 protein [Kitasatospora sp. NPDC094015]|uniref:glycosyl hydrolase family 18 protein n=1 Tax=Kitasatospora sp. NPDC094015 TaxID=3155205 RepID=UPI00332D7466
MDFREGGAGADLTRLPATAFDEIVIGPVGIIGDQGESKDTINKAAVDFKIAASESDLANHRGEATFTDGWGDVLAYVGFGFDGWFSDDAAGNFTAVKAHGLLGAAVRLHRANPKLKVGLHVGGWKMSEAFHHIAKEAESRTRFAESLARIFRTFPMFTTLHLDWRYPGAEGAPGNDYGPEDPENYASLIRATKNLLDPLAAGGVTIAVSLPGTVEKLKAANVPLLADNGASRFNLHTLDYFGTPWAEKINHHANLRRDPNNPDQPCVDDAVQYLINDLNIDPHKIHLAYATHTRNAQRAEIKKISPLSGEYEPYPGEATVGTVESGTSRPADVWRNYYDLEAKKGRNGFTLYTDTTSDADFLYNEDSKVFFSLDTPRSVKSKAEYAATHKLGGLFAFDAEADNGLLANAAREGLGHTLTDTVIDMKPLYITGES